jgi:hypothetical protein
VQLHLTYTSQHCHNHLSNALGSRAGELVWCCKVCRVSTLSNLSASVSHKSHQNTIETSCLPVFQMAAVRLSHTDTSCIYLNHPPIAPSETASSRANRECSQHVFAAGQGIRTYMYLYVCLYPRVPRSVESASFSWYRIACEVYVGECLQKNSHGYVVASPGLH